MTPTDDLRVAVVTGASRGLGAVIAEFLARDGYRVVLAARGPGPLASLAQRLREIGAEAIEVVGDVNEPSVRERLAEAIATGGRLDLLVNNASELGPSPLVDLLELAPEEFERILRVNLLAPIALVRALLAPLERAGGLVVNISSDAAVEGYPRWGGYGASKAALDLATRTLAKELRSRGIALVSVDPGDMRTAMHQAAFVGEDISDRPLPSVTLPFWAWLVHQPRASVTGLRFRAQADRWEVPA